MVDREILNFVMTYKFSQDKIGFFFSAIRMRGGLNDNPNVKKFISAYRRLLSHNEIKASEYGNAVDLENIKILNVSSSKKVIKNSHLENLNMNSLNDDGSAGVIDDKDNDDEGENQCNVSDVIPTRVVGNIVTYISGFVGRKLRKALNCRDCSSVLSYKLTSTSDTVLLNLKRRALSFFR